MKNCVAFVETAPSFEQISQSITGLLTDSAADETAADESCDEMFSTAALSAEYQQISTWCWVNIRVCFDVCPRKKCHKSVSDSIWAVMYFL